MGVKTFLGSEFQNISNDQVKLAAINMNAGERAVKRVVTLGVVLSVTNGPYFAAL